MYTVYITQTKGEDPMVFSSIVSSLISLMMLVAAGYFLQARGHINADVIKGLSAILISVVQPLLMIQGLQQPYSPERLRELGLVGIGFIILLLAGLVPAILYCRIKKIPMRESGAWINCVIFTNAVFMVRPMALALWGDAILIPMAGVMFCYNLTIFTLGSFLFNIGGEENISVLRQAVNSFKNPAMVMGIVGLLFFIFSVRVPAPVMTGLDMLVSMGTPIAMMIIGAQLAEAGIKSIFLDKRVYILTFLRLIVAPLITWLALRAVIKSPAVYGFVMLVAMMPTGANTAVFAGKYENNPKLVSSAVFVSTILSLITIPLFSLFML